MTDADIIERANRIADAAFHRRTHPEWTSLRDFAVSVLRQHDQERWKELRAVADAVQLEHLGRAE